MLYELTPFWLQGIQGNDWSKFDIRKCDCTYFDTFTISSGIVWVKTEEIDFFYILVDVLLYRYMFVFFNVFFLHLSWCITGTCLCSSMYFFYILVDVLQIHVCVLQCIFISIFIVLLFIFSADFSAWSRWYGVSLVIVNKTDILYICNT